uniref:hypothetical protein n=1 Tax=Nonomuraea pusilla TaxID=46177 RepID=UPI0006E40AA0|nr:hypothetical protein [Nonomuraea pusilla]
MKLSDDRMAWFVSWFLVAAPVLIGLNILTHEWRDSLPTAQQSVVLILIAAASWLAGYGVNVLLRSTRRRDRSQ